MTVIAKISSTKCGNVVLKWRSVIIRRRAKVVVDGNVIEGEIASCIGRDAAWKIGCENEKYPDGDTCKIEQC